MNLRLYPDPILRTKATRIKEVTQDHVKLGNQMLELMKEKNGIGLAAQQVGLTERIIAIDTLQADKFGGIRAVMFNPAIAFKDDSTIPYVEGCLSFPGQLVPITSRSQVIQVNYLDGNGVRHNKILMGLTAIAVQHEIDHLDGILFTDKEKK